MANQPESWIIPAGRPRAGQTLSRTQQKRYEGKGLTKEQYESGASVKVARGHGKTPEHPREAERHPERYPEYGRQLTRDAIKSFDRLANYLERTDTVRWMKFNRNAVRERIEDSRISVADKRRIANASPEDLLDMAREDRGDFNPGWYH